MSHVRAAVLDDLDVLTHLLDEYRQFYQQPSDPEGARRFLSQRFGLGDAFILVSENARGRRLRAALPRPFHRGAECALDAHCTSCRKAAGREVGVR